MAAKKNLLKIFKGTPIRKADDTRKKQNDIVKKLLKKK